MEYYEEEFLEFEEYAKITGLKQRGTCESNENTPDFMLAKFAKYEKWMKAEHGREWKKFLKSKQKRQQTVKKEEKSASQDDEAKSFQVNVCDKDETNNLNAIRLSLMKAISSTPYQKGSRCESIKSVCIDVPCATDVFLDHFVKNCPLIKYHGEDNYKCTVTASDLQTVFSTNWDTCMYRGSNTMRRIIGLILIHYRKKVLSHWRTFAQAR